MNGIAVGDIQGRKPTLKMNELNLMIQLGRTNLTRLINRDIKTRYFTNVRPFRVWTSFTRFLPTFQNLQAQL